MEYIEKQQNDVRINVHIRIKDKVLLVLQYF